MSNFHAEHSIYIDWTQYNKQAVEHLRLQILCSHVYIETYVENQGLVDTGELHARFVYVLYLPIPP